MTYTRVSDFYTSIFNYIIEGLAVGIIAYFILYKKITAEGLLVIIITASATFAVIDVLSPKISDYVRQGTGFGLGATLTGIHAFRFPGIPYIL